MICQVSHQEETKLQSGPSPYDLTQSPLTTLYRSHLPLEKRKSFRKVRVRLVDQQRDRTL